MKRIARAADLELLEGAFRGGELLTKKVAKAKYGIGERAFRQAVSSLRERGVPVVSFSEQDSTYHWAHDEAELERFLGELISRSRDLEAQVRSLRDHKREHFAPVQLPLMEAS